MFSFDVEIVVRANSHAHHGDTGVLSGAVHIKPVEAVLARRLGS